MPRRPTSVDDMPLFPSEEQIARAVLGPERAREWPELARYLEDRKGFPPCDHLMGGRSWAKVQAFFRLYDGLDPRPAAQSDLNSDVRILPKAPDRKPDDAERETAFYPQRRAHRLGRSRT